LGVSPGRVNQELKWPQRIKAEAVIRLISHLADSDFREQIVEAWKRAKFGPFLAPQDTEVVRDGVSFESRQRQIDALLREHKPEAALFLAEEACYSNPGPHRGTFALRACHLHRRLDHSDRALQYAQWFIRRGNVHGRKIDVAYGLLLSAECLQRLDGV